MSKQSTGNTPAVSRMNSHNWKPVENIDSAHLERALRTAVTGEVRFDAGSKAAYSVDGSNYRQVPIGVVVPKTVEDVIQTVEVCRKFGAPVLSRGGGTSLSGQCCNVAIVIDWTKYLHKILEVNPEQKYARVQPGAICDHLRHAAAPFWLTWGPDPATHTHCTFGGMLGNNSCGVHSQMAGKAVENTLAMDILLYDGTRLSVGSMSESDLNDAITRGGRVGQIYQGLKTLREKYAPLIERRYPKIPRRVSGYNLDELLPGPDGRFNLARALVGSEGTCVTMLEAKVNLVYSPPQRVLVVLGFPTIEEAADHVAEVVAFQPAGLEAFDDVMTSNIVKKDLPQKEFLSLLPQGAGWLLVEFAGETEAEAVERANRLINALRNTSGVDMKMILYTDEQRKIWIVRESALGANSFIPGEPPNWEGWEDSAVAPGKIGPYLRDLRRLYKQYGYRSALYGHFGQGCIHCRVNFDLESVAGIAKWRAFMEEATDLVVSYGGSISGEHGDGQSKAEYLHKMFGPELIEAFREFKSIWDPDWKMNPGKIVDPYRIDENLRLGGDHKPLDPGTHFHFPDDQGSFQRATLRCVGVGKCRRWSGEGEQDTMCPSYMVTLEEKHSTRGRAHLLWEMLQGDVIKNGWRDENVKEALDLCLSCKGCKGDCPVNVDIATYKAEFLSHYWEGRMRPRYAYAFGFIDRWARLASVAPGFVNLFTQLPGLSTLSKWLAGMPQQRAIPAFAPQSFKAWFRKRGAVHPDKPKVILWADTFNNYFFPETAKAAVEVLEAAGYQVMVPDEHLCCGRPLYDFGFLALAKSYLQNVVRALTPEIEAGTSMVVLEPSCCSVFRDELKGMLPHSAAARKLIEQTFTLAEFLEIKSVHYQPPKLKRRALVQGHCHQKAIMRLQEEKLVMQKMGLEFQVLESGCCGMAGSFGYEKDKYDISIACGERVLLPQVRSADLSTVIMADGFSCKEQIEQQTSRHALHLAEVMQIAMHNGDEENAPETSIVDLRLLGQKKSMSRAAVLAGVVLVALVVILRASFAR